MLIDNHGDVKTFTQYDENANKMIQRRVQDVDPYFKSNARARATDTGGWKGDMHHVASIPLVVFEDMCRVAGCDLLKKENHSRFVAMLNDPDWMKVRTKAGRI